MYIFIITGIIIALLAAPESFDAGKTAPILCLLGTLALSVVPPMLGFLITLFARRKYDSQSRLKVRILEAALILYRLTQLAAFALAVYWLNWVGFVLYWLDLRNWIALDSFLIILPFIVSLFLSLLPLYYLEKSIRKFRWRLGEYVVFHIRHSILIILVPWLLYITISDMLTYLPGPIKEALHKPIFYIPLVVLAMAAVYALAPLVIRALFATRPLEPGPLKSRLEDFCKRARFKCKDIRVWKTGGGAIVNACVLGTVSRFRYIFITDALIERLTPEEIEAVFGHEVGHARGHHIPFYLFYVFCFFFVISATEELTARLGGIWFDSPEAVPDWFSVSMLAGALLFYWGLLFGYISRRFERQADIYGALAAGNVFAFINALEKIAYYNGLGRSRRSWRHFSIEKRVKFLAQIAENPAVIKKFMTETAVAVGVFMLVAASCFIVTLLPYFEEWIDASLKDVSGF